MPFWGAGLSNGHWRRCGDKGRSVVETASLTVDFLAGGEKVQGMVVFSGRPPAENVGFVASYLKP